MAFGNYYKLCRPCEGLTKVRSLRYKNNSDNSNKLATCFTIYINIPMCITALEHTPIEILLFWHQTMNAGDETRS